MHETGHALRTGHRPGLACIHRTRCRHVDGVHERASRGCGKTRRAKSRFLAALLRYRQPSPSNLPALLLKPSTMPSTAEPSLIRTGGRRGSPTTCMSSSASGLNSTCWKASQYRRPARGMASRAHRRAGRASERRDGVSAGRDRYGGPIGGSFQGYTGQYHGGAIYAAVGRPPRHRAGDRPRRIPARCTPGCARTSIVTAPGRPPPATCCAGATGQPLTVGLYLEYLRQVQRYLRPADTGDASDHRPAWLIHRGDRPAPGSSLLHPASSVGIPCGRLGAPSPT